MFKDIMIHSANIMNYQDYIPKNYHEQIIKGELSAIATYDGDKESGNMVGISVTGSHAGWLEIVWLTMGEKYLQAVQTAEFLRYVFRRSRKIRDYVGAFTEIHMDENTSFHKDILILAGMELHEAKNNIYELKLSEVEQEKLLYDAAKKSDCIFLEDASDELLSELEDAFAEDSRALPVPTYMDWDFYKGDLSVICQQNGKPTGAILVSEVKDYLLVNLVYGTNAMAVPAVLGKALMKAKETYDGDKKILMPLVAKGAVELIEKLAPKAKRGDIMEAVVWFKKKKIPKAMRFMLEQMSGESEA